MAIPTYEPAQVKVRARDVRPYHYAVWCTVGESDRPFANEIVSVKWSEDGEKLWFMLESHNFLDAGPDEELELVPIEPSFAFARDKYGPSSSWQLPPRPVPHDCRCDDCKRGNLKVPR